MFLFLKIMDLPPPTTTKWLREEFVRAPEKLNNCPLSLFSADNKPQSLPSLEDSSSWNIGFSPLHILFFFCIKELKVSSSAQTRVAIVGMAGCLQWHLGQIPRSVATATPRVWGQVDFPVLMGLLITTSKLQQK